MRINKFIALCSGISRRAADIAVTSGRVNINSTQAQPGTNVGESDLVMLDGKRLTLPPQATTIIINKPVGYVVSRRGQGSRTIYDLLPVKYHNLKAIGRLDKDSSGLLLLTNDGQLANRLTHPRYAKTKIYQVTLDKPLKPLHQNTISQTGVNLEDGLSRLMLTKTNDSRKWQVTMHEGRNRQIRRTFASLGYKVTRFHRIQFGTYRINDIKTGNWQNIYKNEIL